MYVVTIVRSWNSLYYMYFEATAVTIQVYKNGYVYVK